MADENATFIPAPVGVGVKVNAKPGSTDSGQGVLVAFRVDGQTLIPYVLLEEADDEGHKSVVITHERKIYALK